MRKVAAVYLTHSSVPGWAMTAAQAARLEERLPGYEVRLCSDDRSFLQALPEAEIAVTWFFRREWASKAVSLRVLATPAAGRDYFSVDLPGSVVRIHGRFHGRFMAETALGMLLGMRRGLLQMASEWRSEAWPRARMAAVMRPLEHSTTMIFGMGNIGGCIGRLLKSFGNRIVGVRRRPDAPKPSWFAPEDRMTDLAGADAWLPRADQVVLILPGTPDTDLILNERRLSLLPPHAVVCNLGRGNAVDEDALVRALTSGRIAGACLDVFQREPLPEDSPLRRCPNLWWQPHSSAISPDYLDAFIDDLARQLEDLGIS